MAQSIRCPRCGKTYTMKPELLGKQVRCGQCKKAFTVTVPKPPDDELDEPILLTMAPAAPASAPGPLDDLLSQEFPGEATSEQYAQGRPLPAGSVSSARQTVLAAVATRRRVYSSNLLFQRLRERKLPTTLAVISLGLLLLFVALRFLVALPWSFLAVPMTGLGLAALGLWLPVVERRRGRGVLLDAGAARIAGGSGVIGLILLALFGILYVASRCGLRILPALGLSFERERCAYGGFLPLRHHRRISRGLGFDRCGLGLVESGSPVRFVARGRRFYLSLVGISPLVLLVFFANGTLGGWVRDHYWCCSPTAIFADEGRGRFAARHAAQLAI